MVFNTGNRIYLSTLVLDKQEDTIAFCKPCHKALKTYRQVRYHLVTIHGLTNPESAKISKAARLLEYEK